MTLEGRQHRKGLRRSGSSLLNVKGVFSQMEMESAVLDKESPIPTIDGDISVDRSITSPLAAFGPNDGRIQIQVAGLQLEQEVKLLLGQQQNASASSIHFITHPSQDVGFSSNHIQFTTLHTEAELHSTTNEPTAIHVTQDKDSIFTPFQIQDKIRPDLLDLRNISTKPAEDEKRAKFISQKLKNIKANIDELYKKTGIATIALAAFDGNVQLSGPDHLKHLEENILLKTVFLNAVNGHDELSTTGRKQSGKKKGGNGKITLQHWTCGNCGDSFGSEQELVHHRLVSHNEYPSYTCDICDKKFVDESVFQKHIATHQEANYFRCKVCGISFTAKNLLTSHLKIHNSEKSHQCNICSKSFSSSSSLRYHMSRHNGSNKCICSFCNKEFTKTSSLKVHMRIHSGEQPYRCRECGKSFVVSTHLTRHLRVHSGERPYLCEVCGKRFNRSSHLKIHFRIHSGEKPYECEICGKRFSQTITRKKHMKSHANLT